MSAQTAYAERINLVLNYIRANLTGDLSLAVLAQVAAFSPFHFHRIFSTVAGETVNDAVNRLRLERAAALLRASPAMTITDAAFACGFESLEGFSRAFKRRYGISPRRWDRRSPLKNSKDGQVLAGFPRYTEDNFTTIAGEFEVAFRALPPQPMVYIRVIDSYQPMRVVDAHDRLTAWYRARGGDPLQARLFGMSQDDPEITPLELCRYDVCLTAPDDWRGDGEVETQVFPACTLAYVRCVGDIYVVDRAWQYLFRYWLPRSGFQPDNLPAMEIYHRQPAEIGWETYDLDAAIPVVKL